MAAPDTACIDGNEAAARVAYRASSIIVIYPITPSSAMAESCDAWAAAGVPNLLGEVPRVVEMQSEAGAAGAAHGALSTGSLTTTFTASQGLLLMIPNMYKIAGELSPAVFHVAARSLATSALSIFGDHSDVMAARSTGWAMLCSGSPQEAQDLAAVAHAATLRCRVPFLHFFDGFRTSHELQRVRALPDAQLASLLDREAMRAHLRRALEPERPSLRGSAMNPDTCFQAREAVNPYYDAVPGAVQAAMDELGRLTGRRYGLVDYHGSPDAERVLVLMGSGAGAAAEAVDALAAAGEKVGLLVVRLFRPFPAAALLAALPAAVRGVAVLDRTKEPGALGEPLFLDVLAALAERGGALPRVIGGRYGLSSKEFTPAMAAAALAELSRAEPRRRFTVGIADDVTGLSLPEVPGFDTEDPEGYRAVFYGLGSDGTVGANKNSVKVVAELTDLEAQAYFVYDSKKSGSMTVSHLRFSRRPIRSTYLVGSADLVACHQESLLSRVDVLERAKEGGTLLLDTALPPARAFAALPAPLREGLVRRRMRLFVIDGRAIAAANGLGGRINTVMQAAFFALSGLAPGWKGALSAAVEKSYGRKSPELVRRNLAALDAAEHGLAEAPVPDSPGPAGEPPPPPAAAPEYVRRVMAAVLAGRGDALPVSALPADGAFPTGTARFEKRGLSAELPVWEEAWCIQCGKCALVCPHAAVRVKAHAGAPGAPAGFKSAAWRGRELPQGTRYSVQASPEDCTGCGLCVEVCPAKDKSAPERKALNMATLTAQERAAERANWGHFESLPDADLSGAAPSTVKHAQLRRPLFEFSGACAGCGETPYLKLLTQLFGDRLLVANATGCSSIYGGNLPSTPWSTDAAGRGPAWSNSLFEDAAEFGLGFRLSVDQRRARARALLSRLAPRVGPELAARLGAEAGTDDAALARRRADVAALRAALSAEPDEEARDLLAYADALVPKSVWVVGGDGWAYDIGYGGLDHVLASDRKVNVLVLDTEVYSNTGGQASKATPRGAVAKFATGGKALARKDLAALALQYAHVYVARVALGADDAQTVRAFLEAEAHPGPSLVVAYSPCIAHGYDLRHALEQQKLAVECGHWPLLRRDPALAAAGKNPLRLDSRPPKRDFKEYAWREARYRMLEASDPEGARRLLESSRAEIAARWKALEDAAREP